MKEKTKEVIKFLMPLVFILSLMVVVFGYVLPSAIDIERAVGEGIEERSGIITEKFRMGNNWVVTYHFVIDDEFDTEVSEYEYYHTDVGEYWKKT